MVCAATLFEMARQTDSSRCSLPEASSHDSETAAPTWSSDGSDIGLLHRWGFKAHGMLANRRGTEHIYGDASGSSNYPLLGSVQQYLNNRNRAEVVCLWGMERPNGWSLYTECNGQYAAFEARYLDPSRRMQFSKAGGGADVMVGIRRGHGMLRFTLCGSYLATLSSDLLTTGLDPESAIGPGITGHLRTTPIGSPALRSFAALEPCLAAQHSLLCRRDVETRIL